MKPKYYILSALASIALVGNAFAISVTPTSDGSALVNEILGSGVTASNISYTGADGQAGTFSGGVASGIGIESGIILTSGSAAGAVGPNDSDSFGVNLERPGDATLGAIVSDETFDANTLSFDFQTTSGDLFFNYVFASEEYNEFVYANVNDVFALFVDGTNVALIPGTTTPVSIDTVNGGNPFGDANAVNSAFFNNNDLNDGGPFFDIQYDGFTSVFSAEVTGLSAGLHTMTFSIADTGDGIYDSAVFIEAGSFTDVPDPPIEPPTGSVPEPSTMLLFATGLLGLAGSRFRKN